MKYEDITEAMLVKHTGRKVYWFKQNPLFKEYVRVYFDQKRYLSDYIDIEISKIGTVDMVNGWSPIVRAIKTIKEGCIK